MISKITSVAGYTAAVIFFVIAAIETVNPLAGQSGKFMLLGAVSMFIGMIFDPAFKVSIKE